MKLTTQQRKVYDYICAHPGCTSHDITRDTFVQKPCARITDLRQKGVKIESIGQKRYPGSRPFERYAIKDAPTKTVSKFEYDPVRNCMVERQVEVAI